jgi:hypothetical protein
MCLKLAYHGCGCISSGGIRLRCECCCGGFSGGDGGVDVDAATRTCPSNANRLPAGQTWARSFLQARALSISCIHRTRVHMVCAATHATNDIRPKRTQLPASSPRSSDHWQHREQLSRYNCQYNVSHHTTHQAHKQILEAPTPWWGP